MKFPCYFIGSNPSDIPSIYTILTYSMLKDGTYIPVGDGMTEIINKLENKCNDLGVKILKNTEIYEFVFENTKITGLKINKKNHNVINNVGKLETDFVISSADYYHTETLLPKEFRNYDDEYWFKKELCPSTLIFHLSLKTQLPLMEFHNLFLGDFDNENDIDLNNNIFIKKPFFYTNNHSKILNTAPENCESIFILIPYIYDDILSKEQVEDAYQNILNILSDFNKIDIRKEILFRKVFQDTFFTKRFNSYRNNSYGLACNYLQTAVLRPSIKSNKIENLFFCGQMTGLGPGIPPCMSSGLVTSDLLIESDRWNIRRQRNKKENNYLMSGIMSLIDFFTF